MANAFKEAQQKAKVNKLLSDCAKMADSGAAGRHRAIEAYAKGAGVSPQVAERLLADRRLRHGFPSHVPAKLRGK